MQATQPINVDVLRLTRVAAKLPCPALSAAGENEGPPLSIVERWAERFCVQLVAWGEGARHHRMGSWERR